MLQGQEWPGLGPGPKPLNTSALSQPDGAREGIGGTEEDQPLGLAEASEARAGLEDTQALPYHFRATWQRLHPNPNLETQARTSPPLSCILPALSQLGPPQGGSRGARSPLGFTFADANQTKPSKCLIENRSWKSIHCGKTWGVGLCPRPMLPQPPSRHSSRLAGHGRRSAPPPGKGGSPGGAGKGREHGLPSGAPRPPLLQVRPGEVQNVGS